MQARSTLRLFLIVLLSFSNLASANEIAWRGEKAAIAESIQLYHQSWKQRDTATFFRLLDAKTSGYFADLHDLAKTATPSEINTLTAVDKLMVLRLKHVHGVRALAKMPITAVLNELLPRSDEFSEAFNMFEVNAIAVDKQRALANIHYPQAGTNVQMPLTKSNGIWRISLIPLYRSANQRLEAELLLAWRATRSPGKAWDAILYAWLNEIPDRKRIQARLADRHWKDQALERQSCDWATARTLMFSARNNHGKVLQHILQCGVDINRRSSMTVETSSSLSFQNAPPLAAAALEGHELIVSRLIRAGARVDQQDDWGYTALMNAVERNHLRIAEQLLAAGADPDHQVRCPDNLPKPCTASSPLISAVHKGNVEMVELLLDNGADAEQKVESLDLISFARSHRREEVAAYLFLRRNNLDSAKTPSNRDSER